MAVARTPQAPEGARERILRAALAMFAEHGYDGVGTKTIAAAAGVPSSLVFHYFGTKERLLVATFEGVNVARAMRESLERHELADPIDKLSAVALDFFRWMDEHRELAVLFLRELISNRTVTPRLRETRQQSLEALAAYLVESGVAPDAAASVDAARAFISSILIAVLVDRHADPLTLAHNTAVMVAGIRGVKNHGTFHHSAARPSARMGRRGKGLLRS